MPVCKSACFCCGVPAAIFEIDHNDNKRMYESGLFSSEPRTCMTLQSTTRWVISSVPWIIFPIILSAGEMILVLFVPNK